MLPNATTDAKSSAAKSLPRDRPPASRALRFLARLPLPVMYGLASVLAFLGYNLIRYRRHVVQENLAASFPNLSARERRNIAKSFYRNIADVALETVKAHTIDQDTLATRVRLTNPEILDRFVAANQSIVLIGTHEANWEWVFLSCTSQLPFAIDAIYKPLHNATIDAFMAQTRTRFGARLIIPGESILALARGPKRLRAIAMLVDQRPLPTDECRWIRFLNQDTPFFVGFEKMADCGAIRWFWRRVVEPRGVTTR